MSRERFNDGASGSMNKSRPRGTGGARRASSIGPCGNCSDAVASTVIVRCTNNSDSCCKPIDLAGPCQCAAHSRFALPLPLQWYTTSPCRAWSAPCARDLASTALDKARSYLSEVIDLCAADIIAMRSENVLSRVTRSCKESLPDWSNSVCGSRNPRPRTHCAGEYPLSSMAELQAQVTAAMSHVTRCVCSGTNLTLNSSSNRLACVFQILSSRSQTAFCCGMVAAVGMGSQRKCSSSRPILLGRKSTVERSDLVFEKVIPHDFRLFGETQRIKRDRASRQVEEPCEAPDAARPEF